VKGPLIHVDAVLNNPKGTKFDIIKTVIEVKGCWHKEILTAMETQLLNRYLKESDCRHGLYLVGWFYCKKWDPRGRMARKEGIDELRKQLDSQADLLSTHIPQVGFLL